MGTNKEKKGSRKRTKEEGFLLSAVMVEDGAAEDYVLLKQKPQSPNRREPDDSKDPETS